MPQVQPHVELLSHTPQPEQTIAMSARLCYAAADIGALKERISAKDQSKFIARLAGMGHLSTFEHASFTFGIEGVSRSLLAQITRHRVASFSVQSQRYVGQVHENGETFDYVIPPAIEALGPEAVDEYRAQMAQMQAWYNDWNARLGGKGEASNEDARFVLPNAAATKMMVTMNARELLHFFSLRCCSRAQWEIRQVAWQMLALVKQVAPNIFAKAGPGCVSGACPEGKMSCGQAEAVRRRAAEL